MDYLRCVGVISPEEPVRPPTPAERCVQEYAQYLREQRDLAEGTIANYAKPGRYRAEDGLLAFLDSL